MKKTGMVYLIGAGPGRPDLLTLRGAECLARADAVLVDALVDRRVLEHCRPGVRVIDAGKRGHGRVLMRQPAINRLMVRLARAGRVVARLKGGDPYFFGRGGEEAAHLASRRVPFEVVPGVSSVTAAPAFAGIPVTHRDHTSQLTVVTGHPGVENTYHAGRRGADGVDWERVSPRGTLVILMGVTRLNDIARRLLALGWRPDTPAAVVRWGTTPFQKTVEGDLRTIAARVRAAGLGAPAVIVIGSVVAFRRKLNWFEKLPLFGRVVMVTRAQAQASALTHRLEALGARVLEAPLIRVEPLPPSLAGRRFLRGLSRYDGVLFTSANAVDIFVRHWRRGRPRLWPAGPSIFAIGAKTAAALTRSGLPVHGVAEEAVSEGLRRRLGRVKGKRFLLPRAEEGRDALVHALRAGGAAVDLWPLYRTRREPLRADARRALREGTVDAVAFTASSAVRAFANAWRTARRRKLFSRLLAASIGPVTTKTLRAHGFRRVLQAPRATVEDLADALARRLAPRGTRR